MKRTTHGVRLLAFLALAWSAGACDRQPEDGANGDADSATPGEAMGEEAPAPIPPAILGEGGPLEGTDLEYVDGDPATTGYLAVPDGPGPFPALVIIHEWDGLQPRVRQLADDLADEGYVTLAADLFRGRTGSTPDENRALVAEVNENPDRMIANLNAAVAYLRGREDVTGRVGAMGWCFGGGIALSFGLDGDNHEATAIFYGRLLDDPAVLASLDHAVYGTFGELDDGIPPDAVASFEAALDSAGVEHDVHVYDDVGHGFWLRVDEDPAARTAPAADAWARLKAYLERTLGA